MPTTPRVAVAADGCTAGRGVVARTAMPAGAVIATLADCIPQPVPSMYTIQTGVDSHVDGPVIRYLNHSCDPNVHVDVVTGELVALRDIRIRDELTFFYPSTEWHMVSRFACRCASMHCIGTVAGAHSLVPEQLRAHRLNPHVRHLLAGIHDREQRPAESVG